MKESPEQPGQLYSWSADSTRVFLRSFYPMWQGNGIIAKSLDNWSADALRVVTFHG